jgi:hypothetical protein
MPGSFVGGSKVKSSRIRKAQAVEVLKVPSRHETRSSFCCPPSAKPEDLLLSLFLFLSFSAQKSHVKSQNHLNLYVTTTSEWHFSSVEIAILDIEIKGRVLARNLT